MKLFPAYWAALAAAFGAHALATSCTPQQAAQDEAAASRAGFQAQGPIVGVCSLAEPLATVVDPSAAGAVDLLCNGAEAVDRAAQGLAPQGITAKVVHEDVQLAPDGGAPQHVFRVRCMLRPKPVDAGRD